MSTNAPHTPIWIVMPILGAREYTTTAIADGLAQTVPTRLLLINQGVEDPFREELERYGGERMTQSEEMLELRAIIRELVLNFGPWHDYDCPGDDTCDCSAKSLHDRINAVLREE